MTSTGARTDPYSVFNFIVEIDGIDAGAVAGFQEVSGLVSEVAVIDYREGSEDITVRKLPGLRKYTNVVLKRGVTRSDALWNWHKAVLDGQVERRNVGIVLLNEARQPEARFALREAWPCKWEGPTLNAANNEVAIETLELAHEGLVFEV